MDIKKLDGKLMVLDYSFGPYWNEETGGDNILTIWRVKNGGLNSVYHPGEPDLVDYQRPLDILKNLGVRQVYTPSVNLYIESNEFLGLKMRNDGGEHTDEGSVTDWTEYQSICEGEYNWDYLKGEGLEIIVIN